MAFENKEALATAFKQVQVHLDKIDEMDITADWTEDQIDTKVKELSEEKALLENSTDWKKFSKGQQFYVEQLVKEAGMSNEDLLKYHYKRAFADVATEDEMLQVLNQRRPQTKTAA